MNLSPWKKSLSEDSNRLKITVQITVTITK